MKTKEVLKLKPGSTVKHKKFRKATVSNVMFDSRGGIFGICIIPSYWKDRIWLSSQTGMHPNTPFVEDNLRNIQTQ